jgi:tetratricopeptide (TPR) repeat protein
MNPMTFPSDRVSARLGGRRALRIFGAASGIVLGVTGLAGLASCASDAARHDAPAYSSVETVDLGSYSRKITTSSDAAQREFDRGLRWMYSFNHDEAVKAFKRAGEADPSCAMAWWGIAICRGPHINNPAMTEQSSREAWDAANRARSLAGPCTPAEKALIDAAMERYVDPATDPLPLDPVARAPIDRRYAARMLAAYAAFPDDDDVATIYAESFMDLRPWDLWTLDGSPRPDTEKVVAALEGVLARRPDHPGANHYYIHAVEASRHPELADGAATRLRTLVPGSGHMVHMPAHIDVRTGRWNLAADQNIRAMGVHDAYMKVSPRQGLYRAYMFHNEHFLSYACMMSGRGAEAIRAAHHMVASIPDEFYRDYGPVADAYTSIEVESLMRFGKWDEILAQPEPRAELPITRAMWRFGRGVALAAKGDVRGSRAEQVKFRESVAGVPAGAMMANNPAEKVLKIADEMLEGEILYREGDVTNAVERLKAAAATEDTLRYIEPPDWVQPVRHALGAFLLESGRADEAAEAYREDLKRWPENGWSLFGLARCEEALGHADEAKALTARFKTAWARADMTPGASCLCAQAAK